MRLLPLLVAQVTSMGPDDAIEHYRDDLTATLKDFPATRLVVHPESDGSVSRSVTTCGSPK